MPKRSLLLTLLGAAMLLFFFSRRAQASLGPASADDDLQVPGDDPNYWFYSDQSQDDRIGEFNMGSPEQNLLAALALIRKFETNDRYNVLYGGGTFEDFSKHPNIAVPINLPGYEGKHSTAAGAYQFLYRTWKPIAEKLSLNDFSPASQDAAAVELLTEIGAMGAIQRGDFDEFLRLASTQWASLPYSSAKQSPKTIAAANEFLNRYLENVG